EALVAEFGTDYAAVCHRHAQPELVAAFFGAAQVTELRFPNPTVLDYPTLVLRVASASYMPAAGDPAHAAMSAALEALFARTQSNGHVTFRYTTRVFCAALGTAHGVA
ncbi:MAG TPA: hypothetical protein VER79_03140, partial [Candidatus Limnocylindrales bacterium]|nr:hypothetical protein [Candidatus Limnocylindrales bacterium]